MCWTGGLRLPRLVQVWLRFVAGGLAAVVVILVLLLAGIAVFIGFIVRRQR